MKESRRERRVPRWSTDGSIFIEWREKFFFAIKEQEQDHSQAHWNYLVMRLPTTSEG